MTWNEELYDTFHQRQVKRRISSDRLAARLAEDLVDEQIDDDDAGELLQLEVAPPAPDLPYFDLDEVMSPHTNKGDTDE